MQSIPISLAVEDQLSEAVVRKVLQYSGKSYSIGPCYGLRGRDYLKKTLPGFNEAAKGTPFLVLADLNADKCPPILMGQWLSSKKHHNLLFRIAVREIESWLLADRDGFAQFLRISTKSIPLEADKIDHPKEFLIRLARNSKIRLIREDIVPRLGSTAKIGPNYNGRLMFFVEDRWNIQSACRNSDSLSRTVKRVKEFTPHTFMKRAN